MTGKKKAKKKFKKSFEVVIFVISICFSSEPHDENHTHNIPVEGPQKSNSSGIGFIPYTLLPPPLLQKNGTNTHHFRTSPGHEIYNNLNLLKAPTFTLSTNSLCAGSVPTCKYLLAIPPYFQIRQ